MPEPMIATSWDSIPPVLMDGDRAISLRVLEHQNREADSKLKRFEESITKIFEGCKSVNVEFDELEVRIVFTDVKQTDSAFMTLSDLRNTYGQELEDL